MLIPTPTEINAQATNLAAGATLATTDQLRARWAVREVSGYSSVDYPGLADKLAAVTGYEAQAILAALKHITDLGPKINTVAIEGVTTRRKDDERIGWAEFIVAVLFDGQLAVQTVDTGSVGDVSSAAGCVCTSGCYPCACSWGGVACP
jgi:hypothetical protein